MVRLCKLPAVAAEHGVTFMRIGVKTVVGRNDVRVTFGAFFSCFGNFFVACISRNLAQMKLETLRRFVGPFARRTKLLLATVFAFLPEARRTRFVAFVFSTIVAKLLTNFVSKCFPLKNPKYGHRTELCFPVVQNCNTSSTKLALVWCPKIRFGIKIPKVGINVFAKAGQKAFPASPHHIYQERNKPPCVSSSPNQTELFSLFPDLIVALYVQNFWQLTAVAFKQQGSDFGSYNLLSLMTTMLSRLARCSTSLKVVRRILFVPPPPVKLWSRVNEHRRIGSNTK